MQEDDKPSPVPDVKSLEPIKEEPSSLENYVSSVEDDLSSELD